MSSLSFIPETPMLLKFTVAGLILFMIPGPDMSLCLSKTITSGKKAGMMALLGALIGCFIHTLLAAFSVSAVLLASEKAFLALKIAGAFYLLWLGVSAVRHGSQFKIDTQKTSAKSLLKSFYAGISINLTNPKVILFFVTFFPQFVSQNDPSARAKFIFLGVYFIVMSGFLMSLLIFCADKIVITLKSNPKYLRILDYTFCLMFVSFAIGVLITENPIKLR